MGFTISIKRSMDLLEEAENRWAVAASVLGRLLRALERTADLLAGPRAKDFRERVEFERLRLAKQADSESMEACETKVEQELDTFSRDFAQALEERENEFKQIIKIVAEAAGTLSRTGLNRGQELREFAVRIESTSRLQGIAEIRAELARRVAEVKEMAARIEEDGRNQARELQAEIKRANQRARRAEEMAETNALTDLDNRRLCERTIDAAIAAGQPFSVLLFDLDGFKEINDRYGHPQGDQLLQAVAKSIKGVVRDDDVVCRWGGDEFVVIVKQRFAGADQLAARIKSSAFGEFLLVERGAEWAVKVGASAGVAEHKLGETAADFFARVDERLYANKRRSPARSLDIWTS